MRSDGARSVARGIPMGRLLGQRPLWHQLLAHVRRRPRTSFLKAQNQSQRHGPAAAADANLARPHEPPQQRGRTKGKLCTAHLLNEFLLLFYSLTIKKKRRKRGENIQTVRLFYYIPFNVYSWAPIGQSLVARECVIESLSAQQSGRRGPRVA